MVLFHFEDQLLPRGPLARVDWILNGLVSRLVYLGKFSGLRGEALLLSTSGKFLAEKALVLGLGRRSDLNWDALLEAYSYAMLASVEMKAKEIALTVPEDAYPALPSQAPRDLLQTLLLSAIQADIPPSDLRLAFYEKEPGWGKLLMAGLLEGVPEISEKFGLPIRILQPEGDAPCVT
jgi:hypothetical protein